MEAPYNPTGPLEAWRLDGESRSERCRLHHPNSPPPSAVPEVLSGQGLLPVHLPFRSLMCPMDIHQGDDTFDDSTEVMGYQDNNNMLILPGTKEEATQHSEVLLFLLEALGFIVNLEKSHLNPDQELEFLRLSVDSESVTQAARREDKANSQGGSPIASKRVSVNSSAFPTPGQTQSPLFY